MHQYVVFLKAVNVSGTNKVSMAILKDTLLNKGLLNVKTYIQSGNIIISSHQSSDEIKNIIANVLVEVFQVVTTIFIYEIYTLQRWIDTWIPPIEIPNNQAFITFFSSNPESENIETLKSFSNEKELLDIHSEYMFSYYLEGMGKAKINNAFIEKKLAIQCTGRNRNTIEKILALA